MGTATPEKKDRNLELIKDYQLGMDIIDMVAKYRLSTTRIYKILDQYKIPKRQTT